MSDTRAFINGFLQRLDGKIPDEDLQTVVQELEMYMDWLATKEEKGELMESGGIQQPFTVYMVSKKIEGRSQGTLNLYRICLMDMLQTINKTVEDITSNDLRVYLYRLQERRKISDRTLNSRRLVLNSFFNWCEQEGYTKGNPCGSIHPIKYEEKPREPFSDVEMEVIREACGTPKDRAIIEVLYSTGCRCSELIGLKKADVDYDTKEVHLFGKGKKHRISYLNARAEVAVRNYLKTRKDSSEWLFVSDRRPYGQMAKGGIEKRLRNIGEKAGIDHVFPHRIRHTTATDALEHGMDVTELQRLLGHERLDTTMIYAKTSQSRIARSHKKYII